MTPKTLSLTEFVFRKLLPSGLVLLMAVGCATAPTAPSGQPKRAAHPRPQQKPVDAKAQKRYYDQGLQFYSAEEYPNAKDAFEKAVELGPNTALGLKAQENLRKIKEILKTLDELEAK